MAAEKKQKEPVWSLCNKCGIKTRHDVLCEAIQRGDHDYDFWMQHAVVECRGCETRSFRYHYRDIENAFPVSDTEWDMPEDVENYPRLEDKSLAIDGIEIVPDVVRMIYLETVSAIYEGSLILAGLGLRGTIEAVCNDQSVGGGSLDKMIKNLVTKGLISKKDGERLHAIRFLGNDAAHEIKKPKLEQITVAVKIVKHLIASVYTLKQEAEGKLETLISEYDEYVSLIEEKLKSKKAGDELPIAAILGRDIRRIGENRADLEKRFSTEVLAGNHPALTLGKVASYAGSKDDFQHYIKV